MPLYGFICDECTNNFEELVMSARGVNEVVCPTCGSHNIQRQLSLVAGLGSSNSGVSASATCSPGGG